MYSYSNFIVCSVFDFILAIVFVSRHVCFNWSFLEVIIQISYIVQYIQCDLPVITDLAVIMVIHALVYMISDYTAHAPMNQRLSSRPARSIMKLSKSQIKSKNDRQFILLVWALCVSRVTSNQSYYAPCLTCWALLGFLVPKCMDYQETIGGLIITEWAHCLPFWLHKCITLILLL